MSGTRTLTQEAWPDTWLGPELGRCSLTGLREAQLVARYTAEIPTPPGTTVDTGLAAVRVNLDREDGVNGGLKLRLRSDFPPGHVEADADDDGLLKGVDLDEHVASYAFRMDANHGLIEDRGELDVTVLRGPGDQGVLIRTGPGPTDALAKFSLCRDTTSYQVEMGPAATAQLRCGRITARVEQGEIRAECRNCSPRHSGRVRSLRRHRPHPRRQALASTAASLSLGVAQAWSSCTWARSPAASHFNERKSAVGTAKRNAAGSATPAHHAFTMSTH